MQKQLFAVLAALLTLPVFAQSATQTRDQNIDMIARDLHALNRVATVAEDLDRSRQVLLAITDADIRTLRMPREDGTFQWASLQREEGGRVSDEKAIEYVHTEKELRYVTVTGANGYRVEVTVPRKRGAFSSNNRVWVRNVIADITSFDGKASHHEIPVNAWVNPGDSTGVALPEIGKSVKATAELGVESGDKKATAEVSLVQAKLVDDPNSPYFPAVRRLVQIRDLITARDMHRGNIRNAVDEALLSLPGELEKRAAEQAEAARVRRQMAEMGTTTGSINLGDATPDVVREMAEIARLLNGTVAEQEEGRRRLELLIATLRPQTTV